MGGRRDVEKGKEAPRWERWWGFGEDRATDGEDVPVSRRLWRKKRRAGTIGRSIIERASEEGVKWVVGNASVELGGDGFVSGRGGGRDEGERRRGALLVRLLGRISQFLSSLPQAHLTSLGLPSSWWHLERFPSQVNALLRLWAYFTRSVLSLSHPFSHAHPVTRFLPSTVHAGLASRRAPLHEGRARRTPELVQRLLILSPSIGVCFVCLLVRSAGHAR